MSHKVSSCEVVVVGGGVIGAACARAAAARGLGVVLCEPGPDPAAASPASAGMLAAQIEAADDDFRALGVRGRDLYETLAPALRDATGIDIGFWRSGIADVAFDEPTAARLRDAVATQRQAGLRCDWLDAGELAQRVPAAAPGALGALFAPEDGAVNAAALTRALLADAERMGARLLPARVLRLATAGDRVAAVVTTEGRLDAKHVVLAAGAWAPELAGLPRPLPVEPVRGQMAAAPWPSATPPAILYADHGYVLARDGEAVMGSTMEHAGFDCRTTEAGIAQIRRAAARLLPGLAETAPTRTWAGLRPVAADGLPILGADPEVGGLWYAVGHGRNGILLAALTGDIIGDLLASGESDIDLTPFRAGRFFTESAP